MRYPLVSTCRPIQQILEFFLDYGRSKHIGFVAHFQFSSQWSIKKKLHYQICAMAHAMYSNHEWSILVFQLDCDPSSNTQNTH